MAGEFVDKDDEARCLADAEHSEELGSDLVELRGEGGTLPVALVEAASEFGPGVYVMRAEGAHSSWRGAKE